MERGVEWAYTRNMHFVYIIKNSYGNLYIGITDNPTRRLSEHNTHRGADFTKNRDTFSLVFLEEYSTLIQARKREVQIKKWRRNKKEMLIEIYSKGLSTKV